MRLQVVSDYAEQRLILRGSTDQSSSESFLIGFVLDPLLGEVLRNQQISEHTTSRDRGFAYLSA